MKIRSLCCILAALAMVVSSGTATAGDFVWQGEMNSAGSPGETDVDNPILWQQPAPADPENPPPATVPQAGDFADFNMNWSGTRENAIITLFDYNVPSVEGQVLIIGNAGGVTVDFGAVNPDRTLNSVRDAINAVSSDTGVSAATVSATKATVTLPSAELANVAGQVTFTGNLGNFPIDFGAADPARTAGDVAAAINSVSDLTGVIASGTTNVSIQSAAAGADQFVEITPGTGGVFNTDSSWAFGTAGGVQLKSAWAGETQFVTVDVQPGAVFGVDATTDNGVGHAYMTVGASTLFAPSTMRIFNNGNYERVLFVDRDLTLESLTIAKGSTTSGMSGYARFSENRTVTLTGDGAALNFEGGYAAWQSMWFYPGSKILFTGATVDLLQTDLGSSMGQQYRDGQALGRGGIASFGPATVVNLDNPEKFNSGNIGLGANIFEAASTTVFNNLSGVAFVGMTYDRGTAGSGGHPRIASSDALPLNLPGVAFFISITASNVPSIGEADAATIAAGTYQGLAVAGTANNSALDSYKLLGDVTLAGEAVFAGTKNSVTSTDPEAVQFASLIEGFSLEISGRQSGASGTQGLPGGRHGKRALYLGGNDLTTAYGVRLRSDSSETASSSTTGSALIFQGGGLTVGGDLVIASRLQGPDRQWASSVTNWNGLGAGEAGTDVQGELYLAGNYINNSRAMTQYNGKGTYNLAVYMLGGAVETKTYEVGNWMGDGGLSNKAPEMLDDADTHAVAKFSVGKSEEGIMDGNVQLVSQHLNTLVDTSVYVEANVPELAAMEGLITGKLAVQTADSVLDVNGLTVAVQASSNSTGDVVIDGLLDLNGGGLTMDGALSIGVDGQLDLNTGEVLADGSNVMAFIGTGDKTAAWAAVASKVVDSSNPTLSFVPVTVDIADHEGEDPQDPVAPIIVTVWQASSGSVGGPIEFTSSMDSDFVYQNTSGTNANGGHKVLLTIAITNDPNGNADYTVAVVGSGAGVVEVIDTANPLVKELKGSLRTDGSTGAGLCDLAITVTGTVAGEGTGTDSITVRRLGDINGDGFVTPTDKGVLNARLNGLTVTAPTQALDINADGSVAPTDKGLLNAILNGVVQP